MKKYIFILMCIVLSSFSLSCQRNINGLTNPDDFNYPDYTGQTTPIDSKINFSFYKESVKEAAEISLVLTSAKIYPSGGYSIIGGITKTGNIYKVYLKDIGIPECGMAIMCPAFAKFNLSKPAPGNYSLEIYVNGHNVKGLIAVNRDSYSLTIPSNDYIGTANETIVNIPQNLIWGQAESIKPEPYQAFLDSLTASGAQEYNLQPGDYYFFKIDSQGKVITNSVMGMANGVYFMYHFPGDTIITRNLIKRFAKKYQDSIFIHLDGGRGESYYSTVLENEP